MLSLSCCTRRFVGTRHHNDDVNPMNSSSQRHVARNTLTMVVVKLCVCGRERGSLPRGILEQIMNSKHTRLLNESGLHRCGAMITYADHTHTHTDSHTLDRRANFLETCGVKLATTRMINKLIDLETQLGRVLVYSCLLS